MKKVFSKTQDVCDAWAAQNQYEGRTSSNTSFRGPVLYSYGTAIATIIATEYGGVALINSEHYSSGTSKVQGEARVSAKRAGMAIFTVPRMLVSATDPLHRDNQFHLSQEAEDWMAKIVPAQTWHNARMYREHALAAIGTFVMYATIFGLDTYWPGRNPMFIIGKAEKRADL